MTATIAQAVDLNTHATITIDGEQVRVLVCGIDERHGIRITNRQWGGQLDTWVPLTDLTIHG